MTYHSRGRSLSEVIAMAIFCGFLVGFISVLCIGNYFRAKRAMERQKQRRLARLSNGGNGYVVDSSPRSHHSSATSGASTVSGEERLHLLGGKRNQELPRRRPLDEGQDMILLSENTRQAVNLMSV